MLLYTETETSSGTRDNFQIKTIGPYDKWEHTYDISENGELILDHSENIEKQSFLSTTTMRM